jgi:hypothetical protein
MISSESTQSASMSSLIFHTEESQVLVATDTLATSPDGEPFKFTTKAFIVPHLKLIMAGTGTGGFPGRWFSRINDYMLVKGIDALNDHATRNLASMWRGYEQEVSLPDGATVTIYHFGFSEQTGFIHSFMYSSPDFQSERLERYGIAVKPRCSVPENYELPKDIRTIMDDQRRLQASKPQNQRVFIGGEIHVHHLTRDGFHVYTLDRFEDYGADEAAMYENLHSAGKNRA